MTRLFSPLSAWLLAALLAGLPAAAAMAEDAASDCIPGGDGALRMEISGYFDARVDWANAGTRCAGGPRPDGDALRLMFSRPDDALLVVIGITGLARGATGTGLPANLTIVREGRGEFFGSLGADACLVDVTENAPIADAADGFRVSGQGRCLAPIDAVARDGEIRVAPFEFTGLAYWPEDHGDE